MVVTVLAGMLAAESVPAEQGLRPAAARAGSEHARSPEEVDEANRVLAKVFCVALRRKDHPAIRGMIDPEFIRRHGLGADGNLPVEIAPVLGIHNIVMARDANTVLCLYTTAEGDKEALLLRTRWRGDKLFIVPGGPPDSESGMFPPWILRQSLERFLKAG